MITMNKSGTYDAINTKEMSLEFTKDLSLNDLCGNDFILTDLTGENTLTMTNLELENDKFINLTFQDKIYTTENINIEYYKCIESIINISTFSVSSVVRISRKFVSEAIFTGDCSIFNLRALILI